MTNKIDQSLYLDNHLKERNTGSDILGKDAFLKILMAQISNQDPLNPMEDTDFIAQMAQFSSLEQLINLGQSFDRFGVMQEQSMLISYNQFVGKEVTWHKIIGLDPDADEDDENGGLDIEEGTGRIVSIQFKGNTVEFTLEDGTKIGPENISEVSDISKESSLVQASMMIGKTVTWLEDKEEGDGEIDGVEQSGEVISVSFKDGKIMFELKDGTKISADQITKVEKK